MDKIRRVGALASTLALTTGITLAAAPQAGATGVTLDHTYTCTASLPEVCIGGYYLASNEADVYNIQIQVKPGWYSNDFRYLVTGPKNSNWSSGISDPEAGGSVSQPWVTAFDPPVGRDLPGTYCGKVYDYNLSTTVVQASACVNVP